MAVTIQQEPETYTPSDNPVRWTFSSDQTANQNFAFYVEVYVNGLLKDAHLIFPESSNYAHFDAQEYASNSCGVPALASSIDNSASNNAEIYIKVFDRYGVPPSNQTSATSSTVTVFKAGLNDSDFIGYVASDYTYATGSKFLSLFPRTEKYYCGLTESQYLTAITNNAVGVYAEIYLYDENDTVINSASVLLTDKKIVILNVSPTVLIAGTSLTQADFNSCYYYEVYLDNGTGATESFRIYIDTTCDRYGTKRFHFVSSIGGFESFSYTLASEITREIERFSYEKQFGQWNSSNQFEYTLEAGRQQDYVILSKGKMTVTSDWIVPAVQNWLVEELYLNPVVFMELNTVISRVKILNTAYKEGQAETDGLVQEIIQISLSDNRKSMTV